MMMFEADAFRGCGDTEAVQAVQGVRVTGAFNARNCTARNSSAHMHCHLPGIPAECTAMDCSAMCSSAGPTCGSGMT